jgi:hypothetical protein
MSCRFAPLAGTRGTAIFRYSTYIEVRTPDPCNAIRDGKLTVTPIAWDRCATPVMFADPFSSIYMTTSL